MSQCFINLAWVFIIISSITDFSEKNLYNWKNSISITIYNHSINKKLVINLKFKV